MKRKHSGVGALGLGGYASEDEEESGSGGEDADAPQDRLLQGGEEQTGALLPHYRSRASFDLDEGSQDIDAAALDEQRRQSPAAAETSGAATDADTERISGGLDPDDPLSRLPPELRDPLPTACSEQLQAKFASYLQTLRTSGQSLTDSVTHRKAFRNPDFLQKLVDHFHVQEHGSAFPPEIFQPESLPQEDTIDQLMKALERDQERRARMREQQTAAGTARIDFAKGTGALGHMPASGSAGNLAVAQAALMAQQAVARVVGSKR